MSILSFRSKLSKLSMQLNELKGTSPKQNCFNLSPLMFFQFCTHSEIWHLPNLKCNLKQKLLSVSANAIKICMFYPDPMISFIKIHVTNKSALPDSLMQYKLAIQLFKLYYPTSPSIEWIKLNTNQTLTSQQSTFSILKTNCKKVGLNILVNRLSVLNRIIPLSWLNGFLESFKIKCKGLLL